jgi:hypothetical protein
MEKPTKKALSERISKVRKEVKSRAGTMGASTPANTPKNKATPKTTPRAKKGTPGTPASKKRTKGMLDDESDDEGGPDKRGRMPRISKRENDELVAETSRTLFRDVPVPTAAGVGFDDIANDRPKRAASTKPLFKEEAHSDSEHGLEFEASEDEWKAGRDLIEQM